MILEALACVVAAVWPGHAQVLLAPNGGCQEMTFSITAVSDTIVMPPLPDLSKGDAVLAYFASSQQLVATGQHTTTTGTYDIAATYCAPKDHSPDQVQLLVHGATATKEYWTGGAWNGSDIYSWTKYANDHGFATLAVDRLGNGLSARPDPLQEVQLTVDVEILNIIAEKIKNGEVTGTPSKVILVGHSRGSSVAAMLAAKYPDSIDKLVLTGYTANSSNFAAGAASSQYKPAKDVDPARFGTLPEGYLTESVESGIASFCYAGDYDPEMPLLDFATKGTIAVGEVLGPGAVPAPNYHGPVFILTGDKDKPFCGTNLTAPCEPIIKATTSGFPNARNFGYFMPKNTGHCLNFHRSANQSFEAVTYWLLQASNNPNVAVSKGGAEALSSNRLFFLLLLQLLLYRAIRCVYKGEL
jgi:pimeloyl-ACP methyl ester carboxylesterase